MEAIIPHKRPRELHAQTALRGIASMTVFLGHANYPLLLAGHPGVERIYAGFLWKNEAVDLFFVLSGFILYYVYHGRRICWRNYAVARFARIYPAFLLTFVILLAYSLYDFASGHQVFLPFSVVWSNLLLIQNWPLIPQHPSFNYPSWSISVEVFSYLFLFPLLCAFDKRLGYRTKLALVILAMATEVGIAQLTWARDHNGWEDAPHIHEAYRGILCFTAGFFTCSIGTGLKFRSFLSGPVEALMLVLFCSCLWFRFPFESKIAMVLFPLLAYVSAQEKSVLNTLLRGGGLQWLGDISYSIYLLHYPILMIIGRLMVKLHYWEALPHKVALVLYVGITVAAVLVASHWMHFFYERPASQWIRKTLG